MTRGRFADERCRNNLRHTGRTVPTTKIRFGKANRELPEKDVAANNENVNCLASFKLVTNHCRRRIYSLRYHKEIACYSVCWISEDIFGHSSILLPADFQSQGVVQKGFNSVISPADRGLNNQSFRSGEVTLYGPECSVFLGFSRPDPMLPEVVAGAAGVGTVGTAELAQPSAARNVFGGWNCFPVSKLLV